MLVTAVGRVEEPDPLIMLVPVELGGVGCRGPRVGGFGGRGPGVGGLGGWGPGVGGLRGLLAAK